MTAAATQAIKRSPAAFGALALVVLLAAGALSWSVTHVTQRPWEPPPETPVTLSGEHYRVAPSEVRWLESFSALHFSEGEQGAREIVAAEIDAQLERTFGHARARLPELADWYYSIGGEYARLAMGALSFAGLAEPDYAARRAAEILFPEDHWAEDLERLERDAAARLAAHHARVREGWLAEVSRRLAADRVPAPLPSADTAAQEPLALDGLLQEIAARETAAFETRVSLSAAAAGGAAVAPALWRAARARGAASAGRTAVRSAARGASRAGTAAAGGAALCAPTGPAALGCAVIAGAAAWLGTDWALLRVDEHLHREDLVSALEAGLSGLEEQVQQDLLAAYDEVIAEHYRAVQGEIRDGFVPAQTRPNR